MKANNYFPFVFKKRAYLAEQFESKNSMTGQVIMVTDILANSCKIEEVDFLCSIDPDASRHQLKELVERLASAATEHHIREIEAANIAGMEAAVAAREAL